MQDVIVATPGILHGLYPQRQQPSAGLLETALANISGRLLRARRGPGHDAHRFVMRVNGYEQEFKSLLKSELDVRLTRLRAELARQGFQQELVAQSFALIRETANRTLGLRHYDVQVIGGWLMLNGIVVEIETGAGKTLTATLPACTAALAGIPVHIVTVNDYLVDRDAHWMQPLYSALGISVGTITEGMEAAMRRASYGCDITYVSNKQLVFDYLKDRLTLGKLASPLQLQLDRLHGEQSKVRDLLLRGLCFAIVDEADSVLIDESRTPLIISKEGGALDQDLVYHQALQLAERLEEARDFLVIDTMRTIELTERGRTRIHELAYSLGGVWRANRRSLDLVLQALNAKHIYFRDKHYLIKEGKVQIIDEFTGRMMADRSWERGLHQMIEAKEGCAISNPKETLARVSYQQFFRRYLRLAGMTGTAQEVAGELRSVYRLNVVKVPNHWPSKRKQRPTQVLKNSINKWQAVVARIMELHARGQPVLIGTRTVGVSEHLSRLLQEKGLRHEVLNARQDDREAEIIRGAGERSQIVVATNMAGRGTDIKLGLGVAELGGLYVIATELHEARRIDRQLFGRCGRQGDPGSFEMIVSLEDELVEVYCPLLLQPLLTGLKSGDAVVSDRLSWRIVRAAQKAAERQHLRQRRSMLKLDDHLKTALAFSGHSE